MSEAPKVDTQILKVSIGMNIRSRYPKFLRQFTSCLLTLGIISGILIVASSPAQAGIFDFLFQRSGQNRNSSGRRSGGAVRDECPINLTNDGQFVDFSSFQALAPEDNHILTAETHPTFWFNVPFAASENLRHVEFMLLHEDDKTYALAAPILFHLPTEPGIVQFQLPTTSKGLVVDRPYQWFFSIQCDEVELSRNPVLTGTIAYPSSLPLNQQPWPDVLLSELGDRTSPDWQELINAPILTPVERP